MFVASKKSRALAKMVSATLSVAAVVALTACTSDVPKPPRSESSATNPGAAAILPDSVRDSGLLQVGTFAPSPPTRVFEEDGKTLTGLDISIIEAVADSLGLEVEFTNMNWDGLLPALRAGRFQVVAAQVGDHEERRTNGDFVDYYTSGAAAITLEENAGSYEDVFDLCGMRVGFQTGISSASQLPIISDQCDDERPGIGPIQLSPFPNDAAGLVALRSGQVDAHVMDGTAASYQASLPHEGYTLAVALDSVVERTNIGLVVTKGEPDLRDAIAAALQGMLDDGTYESILAEYGLDQYAVKEITINTTEPVK